MKRFKTLALAAALASAYLAAGRVVATLATSSDSRAWRNLSPYVWLLDGVPLQATYVPTPLRSLQQVSCTFAASTSCTATLSPSVTSSASLLVTQGWRSGDNSSGQYKESTNAYGVLTNGTTMTATQGGTSSGTWKGVVAEFIPQFVKSQGSTSIAFSDTTSSGTATIASVNTAKTIVAYTGWTTTSGTDYTFNGSSQVISQTTPTCTLTNATTLTAAKDAAGLALTVTVGCSYLEFK